jgi:high-affinity nickel permease
MLRRDTTSASFHLELQLAFGGPVAIPAANLELALLSAGLLGFRHGFDYDHIAAITDITSVQESGRRGMQLGMLYAAGHALTVAALGSLVICFQLALPRGIDRVAERLVGLTLVVLGLYVLGSLFRGDGLVPRSRFAIMIHAARWLRWKLTSRWHSHPRPQTPTWNYDNKSVMVVGLVHGLGAETPSQLMIFLLAANLGGPAKGFLGLGLFLLGLLLMNALMVALATGLFGWSARLPRFQMAITAVTAVYSLVVGGIFLTGSASLLPSLG